MDLSTKYLGLTLKHPLMPGASPLCDSLDSCKRLEDGGAAAIVLRSLFEEQITREELGMVHDLVLDEVGDADAIRYFPEPGEFAFAPDRYLEHLTRVKAAVDLPVIASLNGTTRAGWLAAAQQIEQAGADALELNFYHVPTDSRESGAEVERRLLDALRADGLVLFNRFYQPDIDPEMLLAVPRLHLSTPEELLLRIRWLAILYGRVDASLAATGGVRDGLDTLKALMAGASAVQVVSVLLTRGPDHIAQMKRELARWLEQHEYESVRHVQGCVSLVQNPHAEAFERGNYMRILQSWRPRQAPPPMKSSGGAS
jgi:dihydroorotate dehydrogenase (fumarate)